MTQVLVNMQADTVIISVDPAVLKVYGAEAKQRGLASGTALIEALIADWPALLAPAQPKARPIVFLPNEYTLNVDALAEGSY